MQRNSCRHSGWPCAVGQVVHCPNSISPPAHSIQVGSPPSCTHPEQASSVTRGHPGVDVAPAGALLSQPGLGCRTRSPLPAPNLSPPWMTLKLLSPALETVSFCLLLASPCPQVLACSFPHAQVVPQGLCTHYSLCSERLPPLCPSGSLGPRGSAARSPLPGNPPCPGPNIRLSCQASLLLSGPALTLRDSPTALLGPQPHLAQGPVGLFMKRLSGATPLRMPCPARSREGRSLLCDSELEK